MWRAVMSCDDGESACAIVSWDQPFKSSEGVVKELVDSLNIDQRCLRLRMQ